MHRPEQINQCRNAKDNKHDDPSGTCHIRLTPGIRRAGPLSQDKQQGAVRRRLNTIVGPHNTHLQSGVLTFERMKVLMPSCPLSDQPKKFLLKICAPCDAAKSLASIVKSLAAQRMSSRLPSTRLRALRSAPELTGSSSNTKTVNGSERLTPPESSARGRGKSFASFSFVTRSVIVTLTGTTMPNSVIGLKWSRGS
jgi:hypothetical protein